MKTLLLPQIKTLRESVSRNLRPGFFGEKGTDLEVGRSLNALRQTVLGLTTEENRVRIVEMVRPVALGEKGWPYVDSRNALLLCDQLISLLEADGHDSQSFAQSGAVIGPAPAEEASANASQALDREKSAMSEGEDDRVLIIHGHDERNRLALKDLLQSKLRLPEPIVMAQQMVPGKALPEKFEHLAASVGFAIALLTPDDLGRASADASLRPRPRQNTLVEIGWFWGRLGRDRVLLLVKDELELPSDLQGVEFYPFRDRVEEVFEKVRDFFEAHRRKKNGA
jgi:predicted nucleotide-binding protein